MLSESSLIWHMSPAGVIAGAAILFTVLLMISLLVFSQMPSISQRSTVPKTRRRHTPTHLLVVLGSGGHTAEMLSMLRRLPLDPTIYTFRTYIVTSGDSFSASKAVDFETALQERYKDGNTKGLKHDFPTDSYSVITVPRARRVHQSFLTAPISTIQCFWACIKILRGTHPEQRAQLRRRTSPYPDLILTNGPAIAVCVVLAAKLLRFLNAVSAPFVRQRSTSSAGWERETISHPLRTIFIESWARVTSFSLSGKILLPFVDRFLVQWPNLEGRRAWKGMWQTEYVGTLVD